MADVVANHMGPGDISSNKPDLLSRNSSYHAKCDIDYNDQTSIEQCWVAGSLPDINTESSDVQKTLHEWISWLVKEYQFDGLRIDTVKHVNKTFWPDFSKASGVYTIGEVFDGDPKYLAGYADAMDGLLNYAVFYPVLSFFQQKGGTSQSIVDMHDTLDSLFPDPTTLGTFVDNHDNARFLSGNGDTALLKNALAYVILARGIPILYYGTEQGYAGGNDPANREDLWRSGYNTQADLYQAISRLTSAKASAGGLGGNDHIHLYVVDGAYAWSRADGNLIVLTTNGGSSYSAQHCFDTKKPGSSWENVYSNGNITADDSGKICIPVSNGEPAVLLARNS